MRFARPIAATRGRSRPSSAPSAADSWPLPPSMTTRFGTDGEPGVVAVVGGVGVREPREAAPHGLRHRREVVLPLAVPDPEDAVVGLLRDALLEHDHRRHRGLLAEVRDVEALDPQRQRLEVQHLAQLLERAEPAQPRALALQPRLGERVRRVGLRELEQLAVRAPLGHAQLDPAAAPLRQQLADQLALGQLGRARRPAAGRSRSARRSAPRRPAARARRATTRRRSRPRR